MSRARPTARAVDPAPLASISQPARAPRPTATPAAAIPCPLVRRLAGLRRSAGRAGRAPDRQPAFALLVRVPVRVTVLLAMTASLVANTPYTPSATLVTDWFRCRAPHRRSGRKRHSPRRDHGISPLFYRSTMSAPNPEPVLRASSKLLCLAYAAIAIAALIATWSQNLAYFGNPTDVVSAFAVFLRETKVTPASRSITVDILLFFLAAAILMVIEARKHGIKFVWVYIAGGVLIAISVTFPLFLLARELRLGKADPTRLRAADTITLAVFAVLIAGLTIWVDAL